jgi:hypothetical protein
MMEYYPAVEFLHIHCLFRLPEETLFNSDNAQFTQGFEEYINSYVTLGSSHAPALQNHNHAVSLENTVTFTYTCTCRFELPTQPVFLTTILLHLPQTKAWVPGLSFSKHIKIVLTRTCHIRDYIFTKLITLNHKSRERWLTVEVIRKDC